MKILDSTCFYTDMIDVIDLNHNKDDVKIVNIKF